MVDVAPPGAMLEVRVRALLTHLSLADSAPSLTFACEMVRRSLHAEARATSLLGLEPARANKMHKSNAVRSMSPQVGTHHSHHGTAHSHRSMHARVAQPCRGTRCRVCRQPSAVRLSFSVLRSCMAFGRLRSASASASTKPRIDTITGDEGALRSSVPRRARAMRTASAPLALRLPARRRSTSRY